MLSLPHDIVAPPSHTGTLGVPTCLAMRYGLSDGLVPLPDPVFELRSPERQGTCHFQSETAPPPSAPGRQGGAGAGRCARMRAQPRKGGCEEAGWRETHPPSRAGEGREREGGGAEGVGSRERRTASGLAGPMHAVVVDTAAALELVLLLRGVHGVLVNHLASALRRLHELHIAACPLACVRERSNTA